MTTRRALPTASRARAASSAPSGMDGLLVEHAVEGRFEPALEMIGERGGGEKKPVEEPRGKVAQLFERLDGSVTRLELELGRKRARDGGVDRFSNELRLGAVDAHRLRGAHALEVTIEKKAERVDLEPGGERRDDADHAEAPQ